MSHGEKGLESGHADIARKLAARLGATRPVVVLDLETTGTYVRNDRIVEIAFLKIDPAGEVDYKVRRINPEMPIPADATAVHGIRDEDVATEPTFRQIAKSLADLLQGCDLVGFNLRWFDLPILQEEFARSGVKFELAGRSVIDACAIFKRNERRDLSAAYAFYTGKELDGAHSAAADTLATLEILLRQMERYAHLPHTAPELHEYCRDPSWVDEDGKFVWRNGEAAFRFGKHAGEQLRVVAESSPDYLDWMLEQDFPEEAATIVREARSGRFPKPVARAPAGESGEEGVTE